MSGARNPRQLAEAVFDAAYLLFALGAGLYLLAVAGDNVPLRLYGTLALVLGGGDAFHLVPRIYGSLTGKLPQLTRALGIGKLVTSVTMTAFYVLLYHVWSAYYGLASVTAVVYVLAALRIALCLLPQNDWQAERPPVKWAILRNIPFCILGLVIVALFGAVSIPAGDLFRFMPLAILLSFAFYVPVVLWAQRVPALGALMLPKTLAYVWILCMGFGLVA